MLIVSMYVVIELLPTAYFEEPIAIQTHDTKNRMLYAYDDRSTHVSYMDTFQTPDGYTMRYLDKWSISGEVIVLLHGTPTSSWPYRHLVLPLVGQWYRVIVPDMIGYGASEKLYNRDELLLQKQFDRLVALMDHLAVDVWHHGSHDMAGLWTRMLAKEFPDRLRSIIFFNTIAVQEGFSPPMHVQGDDMIMKIAAGVQWGRTAWLAAIIGFVYESTNNATKVLDGYRVPFIMGANYAYYQFVTSFDETYTVLRDTRDSFEELSLPMMIVWGMQDSILVGDEQIPVLQKLFAIEDAHIHRYDFAKHLVMEDRPEQISNAIIDFLSEFFP